MAAIESKPFRESAASWLETRKLFISPRTFFDYTKYIKTLSPFFGELRLNEITAHHLRTYQKMRLTRARALDALVRKPDRPPKKKASRGVENEIRKTGGHELAN